MSDEYVLPVFPDPVTDSFLDPVSSDSSKDTSTIDPPVVTDEVKEEVEVSEYKKSAQLKKESCLAEIAAILAEHDNLESNVPVTHRYWGLLNQYRTL